MVEGVCLRVVLQPVSDVVSKKYALVSVALHVVSRSRRCSRSIPRRRDLGMVMVILLLSHWTSTPGAKIEGKRELFVTAMVQKKVYYCKAIFRSVGCKPIYKKVSSISTTRATL